MKQTLVKLFIVSFYKANVGFFLFFFFIFFGSVNGGSLLSYHASLLNSILGSWVILCGVFLCWILYEVKCIRHVLHIINSEEGKFLYIVQALSPKKQMVHYLGLQLSLYAPIVAYASVAIGFGFKHGHVYTAVAIFIFLLMISSIGALVIYQRLNNWLKPVRQITIGDNWPKPFVFYPVYHFFSRRKMMLVGLKLLSVALLYIVLILNKGKNDNDSFLLFYLVILLAHFILPFFAVGFFERELLFSRNLPLQKHQYVLAYLLSYMVLLVPELIYLLLYANSLLSVGSIIAYYGIAVCSLFLLTAVQYSDNMNEEEYMKVGFGLFFVSIFVLHVKAFIPWMCIECIIGLLVFWNGFYKYERPVAS